MNTTTDSTVRVEPGVMCTSQRREPIFWLNNSCPFCEHNAPMVYKPDLLKAPVDFECHSKYNPLRVNWPCSGRWSVAAEPKEIDNIKDLLMLAREQDALYQKIAENRLRLGYT